MFIFSGPCSVVDSEVPGRDWADQRGQPATPLGPACSGDYELYGFQTPLAAKRPIVSARGGAAGSSWELGIALGGGQLSANCCGDGLGFQMRAMSARVCGGTTTIRGLPSLRV